ncbi:MAG TPA: DUF697 domain-containing protein [Steroidobacteraceae bacterium]|nr:DUF697 domain-containing protein [Steroidobacteraceae bacterium]
MEAAENRPSTQMEALKIVNSYMGWSAGAGLIPLPLIDLAAISGVQLKMIHSLSKFYGIPFSRDAAKSVIGALVGGGSSTVLAAPAASLLKFVPVVGQIAGALTEPALAAATTYALGKVFIQHFETGGTFLNFDPEAVREYYKEQFAVAPQEGRP